MHRAWFDALSGPGHDFLRAALRNLAIRLSLRAAAVP
jgi:hypothetical protein